MLSTAARCSQRTLSPWPRRSWREPRRGGHQVPEEKIRERYARLLKLIIDARALADRSTFYDNSRAKEPFRLVATFERGRLVGEASWPAWTPTVLAR